MYASTHLTACEYDKTARMRATKIGKKLNVLFLSSCEPCDIFLIKELMTGAADCVNVCAIIRPVQAPQPAGRWQESFKHPLHKAHGLLNTCYRSHREQQNRSKACRFLFGKGVPELNTEIIDVPENSVNRPRSIEKIASFRPDVILASGAPPIAPTVFSVARIACLNVHYGIAPEYRGEHAQFWPLWLGDYQHIGSTIQYIASGSDESAPLVRGYPALSARDTEFSIAMKSARLSALLIREVLQNMQREGAAPALIRVYGEPDGQLIHSRDRKVWHDLAYAVRRYLLGRHPPEQAQRIERFYRQPSFTRSAGTELVKEL